MITQLWNKISNAGLDYVSDKNKYHRLRIVNQVTFFAIFISVFYLVLDLSLGHYTLAAGSLTSCLLYSSIFHFNKQKKFNTSRIILLLTCTISIAWFASILGKDAGIHLFYPVVLIGIFAIFSFNEKAIIASAVAFIFCGWIFLNVTDFNFLSFMKTSDMSRQWAYSLNYTSALVLLIIVMSYFIRENHLKEKTIEKEHNQLQSIISSTADSIWLIDRNFRLIISNSSFDDLLYKTTGCKLKQGDDVTKIDPVPGEQAVNKWRESYKEVLETRIHKQFTENFSIEKKLYSIDVMINPVWHDNEIVGLVGIARNVSWQKELENELWDAKEVAEASSRAKSQFLSNMSHELRTPMNAIYGLTQLTIKQNPDVQCRENLDTVLRSTEHLMALINDILDLSRIEAGKLRFVEKPFSLIATLERISKIFTFKAKEKNIDLYTHMDPDLPQFINGDFLRINQILTNLTGNAIKFTNKGHVKISYEYEPSDQKDFTLVIRVSDTGIGISEKVQPELFKVFSQGDSNTQVNYGGSGLGLAITKNLVEMQNGQISFESKEGEGSVFTVKLPCKVAKEPINYAINPVLENENNELDGFEVLVIEDNEVNQLVARQMLNQLKLSVTIAEDGYKGLELMKEKPFAVILLDLQMPGIDGFEVASKIRHMSNTATPNSVPVIAISADVFPETQSKAIKAGVNDFIGKPYQLKHVSKVLHKHLVVMI